ncbi:MAG: DUF1080 domain-containing protein, partial [Pseudomonadota bacterium]
MMKRTVWPVACVLGTMLSSSSNAQSSSVPLFNGNDLTGFAAMFNGSIEAWDVVDGEIRIIDAGRGGWIRTDKMYRDFELTFDFLIPEGGNSGVGLRASSVGDPAFTGFEVQIADSPEDGTELYHCGAVYNAIPPMTQAFAGPKVWNTYRIRLVGDTLDVWLNGTRIHDNAKLDDRGIFRNEDQPLPLNDRLTTGYIAFQDHGEGGLRLRNITITDLSPDPDPGDYEFAFDGETTNGWTHRGDG